MIVDLNVSYSVSFSDSAIFSKNKSFCGNHQTFKLFYSPGYEFFIHSKNKIYHSLLTY
jgi:hypothetical protein